MGQSDASRTDPEVSLVIPVRVQPRGSRSEIQGVRDGRLRIKTTAPPADGKANKAVIRQLAKEFGVPPSRIALKSGTSQRNKIFVISRPSILPSWLREVNSNL
jgi:uncharacterized protein (TIGR00251 family)